MLLDNINKKEIQTEYLQGVTIGEISKKYKMSIDELKEYLVSLGFALTKDKIKKQWKFWDKEIYCDTCEDILDIIDEEDLNDRIKYYCEINKIFFKNNYEEYIKVRNRILYYVYNIKCI